MRSRENIPLAVMTVVSAAILLFFVFSGNAMLQTPHRDDGCGWSADFAVSSAARRNALVPWVSWNPAFPPTPPNRPLDRIGCMKSSATAVG
jgi:hypothetical protein